MRKPFGERELEKLNREIVERLLPMKPEKIFLFGSYAHGNPTEESDIDLYIVKSLPSDSVRDYKVSMKMRLRDLIKKYRVGFDLIVGDEKALEREDFFHREEIGKRAKVLYE
ncbi:nucleotidyltransferase domain-containing protein [Hydrogenimonas sp.]